MRIHRALKVVSVLFVFGFLLWGVNSLAADEGADLYKAKCQACHGPDGAGQTTVGKNLKVPDLGSADVQKQSDGDLSGNIAKGKNKMPAFEKTLKPDQISQLVAHIRGLKK